MFKKTQPEIKNDKLHIKKVNTRIYRRHAQVKELNNYNLCTTTRLLGSIFVKYCSIPIVY